MIDSEFAIGGGVADWHEEFGASDEIGGGKSLKITVKMNLKHSPPPDVSVLMNQSSTSVNCLAEDSTIYLLNEMVVQVIVLRLGNVESGEIVLQFP
ncbi:hypothetical protein MA16_Dca025609 [Dendrobium catenatum]|uniref:Uncharacterized protein n=1 Tax=Dendrobium catenatum TaxID=906689 RepID=A0A2I0W179_9ASPA|nr:hypothetical protein MA16_Dca025609 [Dendrobium catenatum]